MSLNGEAGANPARSRHCKGEGDSRDATGCMPWEGENRRHTTLSCCSRARISTRDPRTSNVLPRRRPPVPIEPFSPRGQKGFLCGFIDLARARGTPVDGTPII